MKTANSVNWQEIRRFERVADSWWDAKGPFKPLHSINPLRIQYIRDQAMAHFARSGAAPLSGLSVLDVGCGGGLLCEPMSRLGADVTGIDASEKNIRIAALHAEKSGVKVIYRAITAEALVQENAQFDIVLALEIIEHVNDPATFVASCAALVKPGGLLFLSTLNRTFKSFALAIVGAEYILRWVPRGTHAWEKFINPAELHAHLRHAEMEVKDMQGMIFSPLSGTWRLSPHDLDVNYLLVAEK